MIEKNNASDIHILGLSADSITVVIPRPKPAEIQKWQLAVQDGNAHLITMPHVQQSHIDALLQDILEQGLAA